MSEGKQMHTALRVKPLEWWVSDTGDIIAATIVGRYRLGKVSANTNFRLETPLGLIERPSLDYWPEDEAKAAAQADYERRILSAIEPSPAFPALVEALKGIRSLIGNVEHKGGGENSARMYADMLNSIRDLSDAALAAASTDQTGGSDV